MTEYQMELLSNLSTALVALIALLVALRVFGQRSQQDGELSQRLVEMIAAFQTSMKDLAASVDKGSEERTTLLGRQAVAIAENTQAVAMITAKINDVFMPEVAQLFSAQELRLASEFEPVVKQQSSIYFTVRDIAQAVEQFQASSLQMIQASQQHWRAEVEMLANLRIQQAEIQKAINQMQEVVGSNHDTLDAIFQTVIASHRATAQAEAESVFIAVEEQPAVPDGTVEGAITAMQDAVVSVEVVTTAATLVEPAATAAVKQEDELDKTKEIYP